MSAVYTRETLVAALDEWWGADGGGNTECPHAVGVYLLRSSCSECTADALLAGLPAPAPSHHPSCAAVQDQRGPCNCDDLRT